MRILWYLASQLLRTTLGVFFFALGLYYVITYMDNSQTYFSKFDPSGRFIVAYYFWQLPGIALQILPFALLVGGIISQWVLARHGEISALRAAGMSIYRIAWPFLLVALFFSATHFFVSEVVVPYTSSQQLFVQKVLIEKRQLDQPFVDSLWLKSQGGILHFDKYLPQNQVLQNPRYFSWNQEEGHLQLVVQGDVAFFDDDLGVWVISKGIDLTSFGAGASLLDPGLLNPLSKQVELKKGAVENNLYVTDVFHTPPRIPRQGTDVAQLSYIQLKKVITDAQAAGTHVSDRMIDLYMKVSSPFVYVIFVLLTLPFALRGERQEENYKLVLICLAAALAYWFGNLFLKNFAARDLIPPLVGAWGMNVCLTILGLLMARRLDRGI